MDERVGVGVIGVGMIGAVHARNLAQRVKRAELVAVVDADGSRAQAVAAELGGTVAHADSSELIRDPAVHAVVIASPDPTHAGYVLACLEGGKAVLCEKPMATTAAEAVGIIEAESRAGRRRVQVGFMREFDAAHIAVRRAVESGQVGEPVMFRGSHINPTAGESRASPDAVITSSLIHDIHSARFLMGQEITSVYVTSVPRDPGRPETCRLLTISCTFANGAVGLIDVNIEAAYGYAVSAEVIGTDGTVATMHPVDSTLNKGFAAHQSITHGFRERFAAAYLAEVEAWVAALASGRPVGPSAWDGYASLAVADACRESVATGQPVEVRLVDRFGLYA